MASDCGSPLAAFLEAHGVPSRILPLLVAGGVDTIDALQTANATSLKSLGLSVGARARLKPALDAWLNTQVVPAAVTLEQRMQWCEECDAFPALAESMSIPDDDAGLRARCMQASRPPSAVTSPDAKTLSALVRRVRLPDLQEGRRIRRRLR